MQYQHSLLLSIFTPVNKAVAVCMPALTNTESCTSWIYLRPPEQRWKADVCLEYLYQSVISFRLVWYSWSLLGSCYYPCPSLLHFSCSTRLCCSVCSLTQVLILPCTRGVSVCSVFLFPEHYSKGFCCPKDIFNEQQDVSSKCRTRSE